ncbi:MAG: hypothetical protein WEA28_08935 [Xanthobacteraceae bacterium]
MRRRSFITLIGGALAWPVAARAQQAGRTYRLGALTPSPRSAPQMIALFDELRQLGFIEGQNLTVDWRTYGQNIERVFEFATELSKSQVDVIVAGGDAGIRAVRQVTSTIPILGLTEDMVRSGMLGPSPGRAAT